MGAWIPRGNHLPLVKWVRGGMHPTGGVTAVPHSSNASFLKAIVTSLG